MHWRWGQDGTEGTAAVAGPRSNLGSVKACRKQNPNETSGLGAAGLPLCRTRAEPGSAQRRAADAAANGAGS